MLYLGVGTILFCLFLVQCTILTSFAKENYRINSGGTSSEYENYLTIVCTVDGGLHGIDKYGNKAWSSSTGNPMLSAQNYAAQDPEDDDDDGDIEQGKGQPSGIIRRKGYSILPSTDGTLIYHSMDGMRKTSVTARLLVEQTPFVSGEGISFTGKKSSRLLKLDANSGTILFDSAADVVTNKPEALKTIDGNVNPVWVGRIDYALEAVDTTTGRQEFNFTYSEFVPLPYGSQYEYNDGRATRQQQERGHDTELSGEEEFEVATDVQLGEAEVVQLLGARAAAGWDTEEGDDASPTIDESQGIVDASFDLGVEPNQDLSAVSSERSATRQTRVGKVKRKRGGGRRRRKNRVGMEKRAATVSPKSMTAVSEPLRNIELPDADSLTLISTPDGELYFSDKDGIVLEKVPIKLQSPVFSAFKLQRTFDRTARDAGAAGSLPLAGSVSYADNSRNAETSGRESSDRWGVYSISVMHRVLTYTGADTDTGAGFSHNGLAVAGDVTSQPEPPVNRIIVQSPSSTEKELLYVLEVSELEMPGEDPALAKSLSIGNGADEWSDVSSYPTKRELRAKARADLRLQQQQRLPPLSAAPPTVGALSDAGLKSKAREEGFPRSALKRPASGVGIGASIGMGSGGVGRRILSPPVQHRRPLKGMTGVGPLRLLDKSAEEGSSRGGSLVDADPFSLSWEKEEDGISDKEPSQSQLIRKDIRVCLSRLPSFYFPLSWIPGVNVTLHNTCPMQSLKQLRDTDEPPSVSSLWEERVIIDLDEDEEKNEDDDENNTSADQAAYVESASDVAERKSSVTMRGSHVLRPDLYEGSLFQSDPSLLGLDAQMHLFRGVLHHSHHPNLRPPTVTAPGASATGPNRQRDSSWDGWQRGAASTDRTTTTGATSETSEPYLPVVAKAHPLSWMDIFALKVFAIVEHLLLYLVAVAIVIALVFVLCVYLVRVTPAISHLLPPEVPFSSQLNFALHALINHALLLVLSSVQIPAAGAQQQQQQPKLLSRGFSSRTALATKDGGNVQSESARKDPAVILEGSSHDVALSVAVPVTSAVLPQAALVQSEQSRPPSLPTAVVEEELVDADGKRLLRVGNLIVHCEHVLGYGSHGTTVYRGSLDGRPLAVKRILTQFVRSADREISLLIRSDGHANVVRYFTKEQKSDFVYLGLQLCDMTLKDFVVQVRECSSVRAVETENLAAAAEITEAVKSGLLQIAMGVAHLHAQRIVHRDIKPQNILLARVAGCATSSTGPAVGEATNADKDELEVLSPTSLNDLSGYVLKISDMGLSKQLGRDHGSFSSMSLSIAAGHSTSRIDPRDVFLESAGEAEDGPARSMAVRAAAVGTVGWQAPELISHRYMREDVSPSPRSGSSAAPSEFVQNIVIGEDVPLASQEDTQDSEADGDGDEVTPIVSVVAQLRRDRKKRTLTVDVFSLGCVFYFTITQGEHPFGQWFEREANIAAGKMSLASVQHDPLAVDLLTWMLAADPLQRPTSSEVCGHPFFWTAASKLHFLVEFSDRMEHEPADSPMVLAVEAGALAVLGSRWDRRLDVLLLEDLGKFRKYDTSSVRDLLRVIRNKRHHFHELSPPLKEAIGSIPDGFMGYFDLRFPQLVLHCAYVAHRYLSSEALFRPWARGTRSCSAVAPSSQKPAEGTSGSTEIHPAQQQPVPPSDILSGEKQQPNNHSAPERNPVTMSVDNVVVWQGSALSNTLQCGGWWRSAADWVAGPDAGGAKKNRASHLTKSATDPKYRISLCSHWEDTNAVACPMRKKGKCVFAHGPLELRVKETRRGKWNGSSSSTTDLAASGGEDVLGAARNVSKARAAVGADTSGIGTTDQDSGKYDGAAAPRGRISAEWDGGGKQQQQQQQARGTRSVSGIAPPSPERTFTAGGFPAPFITSRYQQQQQPQSQQLLRGGALPYQPFLPAAPFGQHPADILSPEQQQYVTQQLLHQQQQHQVHRQHQQQGAYFDENAHAYAYAMQMGEGNSVYNNSGVDYTDVPGGFYHHQQQQYPPS